MHAHPNRQGECPYKIGNHLFPLLFDSAQSFFSQPIHQNTFYLSYDFKSSAFETLGFNCFSKLLHLENQPNQANH